MFLRVRGSVPFRCGMALFKLRGLGACFLSARLTFAVDILGGRGDFTLWESLLYILDNYHYFTEYSAVVLRPGFKVPNPFKISLVESKWYDYFILNQKPVNKKLITIIVDQSYQLILPLALLLDQIAAWDLTITTINSLYHH